MMLQSNLLSDNLSQLINGLVQTLPRLFGGLMIIVFGMILARIVSKFVAGILARIGADKLGERINDIDMISNMDFEVKISQIIAKIIYYFVILIAIVGATDVIGMPAISQLFNDILNWIPNLLVALVILAVGLVFAEFVRGIIYTACTSFNIPSARVVSTFAFYFLFINIFISALSQAKVDTSFISSNVSILIAGAAFAFAIGYGLASRSVLSNFLTSHYSKDKIKIGDHITIDGHKGIVKEMDRSNIILSSEGKTTLLPLHKLSTETVEIHNKN